VKIGGGGKIVEADETFIGGLARNMHKDVRKRKIQGTGGLSWKAPYLCRSHGQGGYDGFPIPCVLSAARSGSLLRFPLLCCLLSVQCGFKFFMRNPH
jgi:hypothetical protein